MKINYNNYMYPNTNLQKGMSGAEVTKLQKFLISQGFSIPAGATGFFGDQTVQALTQWQQKTGVQAGADFGFWGPKSIEVAGNLGQAPKNTINFDPNTGRRLEFGQSVVDSSTGRTITQGTEFQSQTVPKVGDPIPGSNLRYEAEDIFNIKNDRIQKTSTDTTNAEKQMESVIESIISSGKTINPNLTLEDLAGITPEEFMRQAELAISPQYKEKFQTIKDTLSRELSNIGYDLNLKKEDIARKSAETLDQGTEELAGRGLAFSGKREQFIGDVAGARTRDEEAARTLAFRNAQSLGSSAEQSIGTSALQNSNLPQIEGRSPFAFSSSPLTGSDVYSNRAGVANYAQGLEGRARDIMTQYPDTPKSKVTRALGFA